MSTRDERYRVIFNGEIYNHRELRHQLRLEGADFQSQSDTEVLLHLYRRHGVEMCHRLRGMYAFAIWDQLEQCLFIARDEFGMKPLYYQDDGSTLRFGSQVKALLAGGAISDEGSVEGESGYWVWGHVPEPHTLYRDINALEPGTWRKISRGGKREQGAFSSVSNLLGLTGQTQAPQEPRAAVSLRDALLDSVNFHLDADVPVGIFLSAGIDSAVLVGLAAECGKQLNTITLGFEEFRGTANDETALAAQVAKHYGTVHQTVWIGRKEFECAFDEFLDAMDQPSIDGLNSWLVSRAAAQLGLKVALSGVGADEFFGGYPSFHQIPRMRRAMQPFAAVPRLGRMVRQLTAPLLRRMTSEKYAGLLEYGGTWEGAYMLRRAIRMPWELSPVRPTRPPAAQLGRAQSGSPGLTISELEATRYMRNQLLRDADWAGMAHSVEIRMPFVDKLLVQHIAQAAHAGRPYTKQDLAAVPVPGLPAAISSRPKTGFVVPVREWMLQDHPVSAHRGLRGWQAIIFERANVRPALGASRPPTQVAYALWAPDMTTHGGVQNYMWCLWESIQFASKEVAQISKGLSLLGTTESLAQWPSTTAGRPNGAGGNRLQFVWMALSSAGRADLVTVGHINQAPVALLAKWLGLIKGYIVVLHGIEAWVRANPFKRLALMNAQIVVATTQYTASTCAKVNDLSGVNFKVIPLCTTNNKVEPDASFRLIGEWPLLFVGRLSSAEQYKGLETTIAAAAALRAEGRMVTLHVVGEGDDRARLETIAKQILPDPDAVIFHGRLTDEKLQSAYRSARTFVMPSAKEGFGIVFLEAMRHGVPCIGGAHGGTPEVFEDEVEGLLVEYGRPDLLADQLRRLMDQPAFAAALGIGGQERFHRDYTYRRFAERWHQTLASRRVIAERHSRCVARSTGAGVGPAAKKL
jgi:asparagine synthase (glutamine-hydrolysing)